MTMIDHVSANTRKEILTNARNYAAADRSDPFTYSRVLSHINSGVAYNEYEAEPYQEERVIKLGNGQEMRFTVTAYKNMKRA